MSPDDPLTDSPEKRLYESAEERMNILKKYLEVGSYRAADRACGVNHKTVRGTRRGAARRPLR